MSRRFAVQLLLLISSVILSAVYSSVIGIDFASDALKVAIVQPKTPLEIGMSCLFGTDLSYLTCFDQFIYSHKLSIEA